MTTTLTDDYDSPWKDILERYLADFLAFFFPQAHTEEDGSRAWRKHGRSCPDRYTAEQETGTAS